MSKYLPKPGERVPRAAEFIPNCEKLLDVGCGDGMLAHFIKDKVSKIYGVDTLEKDLKKAEKIGVITNLVNIDKEKLPYKANTFDVVTSLDVIEHVIDPRDHIEEIFRVLKKGGRVVLSTPNIRFSDHIMQLVLKGTFPKTSLDPDYYDGGHIHFFTYRDIQDLLEKAGFHTIEKEGIINKVNRGWKGRLIQKIVGEHYMREFRTPGILIIATK